MCLIPGFGGNISLFLVKLNPTEMIKILANNFNALPVLVAINILHVSMLIYSGSS